MSEDELMMATDDTTSGTRQAISHHIPRLSVKRFSAYRLGTVSRVRAPSECKYSYLTLVLILLHAGLELNGCNKIRIPATREKNHLRCCLIEDIKIPPHRQGSSGDGNRPFFIIIYAWAWNFSPYLPTVPYDLPSVPFPPRRTARPTATPEHLFRAQAEQPRMHHMQPARLGI